MNSSGAFFGKDSREKHLMFSIFHVIFTQQKEQAILLKFLS